MIPPDEPAVITKAHSLQNHGDPAPTDITITACDIELNWNQPIFMTTITIRNTGTYPTRGHYLKPDEFGVLINTYLRGTPAAKVTQWRRHLKNTLIHSINGKFIKAKADVKRAFDGNSSTEVLLKDIPPESANVHEETGLPQLNFGQFIGVASQHQDILHGNFQFVLYNKMDTFEHTQIAKLGKKTLTHTHLLKRPNCDKLEKSEFLQLDQYDQQYMFGNRAHYRPIYKIPICFL